MSETSSPRGSLNRANFNQPVNTVNTPNPGTIVEAAAARSMQVALRYSF